MVHFIITGKVFGEKKFSPTHPISAGGPFSAFLGVFHVTWNGSSGRRCRCLIAFLPIFFVFLTSLWKYLGAFFFVLPNFHFWALERGPKLVPGPKKNKNEIFWKNIENFFLIFFWVILNRKKNTKKKFGPFLDPFWGPSSPSRAQKNAKMNFFEKILKKFFWFFSESFWTDECRWM